jgi:hypothetical protein
LTIRRLLAEEKVGDNLARVKKELTALQSMTSASSVSLSADEDAAAYGSTTSTAVPGDEQDTISVGQDPDSGGDCSGSPSAAPTMFTLTVSANGEDREFTVCLSATRPQNAWEGSLGSLTHFLAVYGGCSCDVSMKDYTRGLATPIPAPVGNASWGRAVEGLRGIAYAKQNAAVAIADNVHPMPLSMTRSDGLQIQRIMKKYMISERARKQRQKLEQARRQHLIDEGADEDLPPEELEAKWRIAPSQHELSGLLVEESKQNASIAAFTSMFPLLQRRVAAKDALRMLEETSTEVVSPAEAARCATEVRLATRPHTTAAQYKDSSHSDAPGAARPASVEPTPVFFNPPALRAMSRPTTQAGAAGVEKKYVLPEEVLDVYGRPQTQPQHARQSPSPIHSSKDPHEISHHAPPRGPASTAPHSPGGDVDRNLLLQRTAVDWSIGESEAAIASKPTAFRATAAALRAFAASISSLADAYDENASKLDASELRFRAAMSLHAQQFEDDAEELRAEKQRDTSAEMVSFAELRVSPHRSPVLPPASPTQWGGRAVSPLKPLSVTLKAGGELDAVRQKQRQLRALLPSIDHHSTAYRMVVKELADNERLLQQQREAETIAKLAKDAQLGAERRKSMAHRSPGRTPPLDPTSRPVLGLLSGTTSPRVSPNALAACSWMLAILLHPTENCKGSEDASSTCSPTTLPQPDLKGDE